jgi:hypothetical protein
MLKIQNYKKLEGYAHNYKDFRIGEIIENENEYLFRVGYNGIPYIIKIFRESQSNNEYEVVLRDGSDVTQFGRNFIRKENMDMNKIIRKFESLIKYYRPLAQQTIGNTNFNNPF